MSSRAAKVNGVVLIGDSLPAVGVRVVLVPDAANHELKHKFVVATAGQNVRFSMSGITPGELGFG